MDDIVKIFKTACKKTQVDVFVDGRNFCVEDKIFFAAHFPMKSSQIFFGIGRENICLRPNGGVDGNFVASNSAHVHYGKNHTNQPLLSKFADSVAHDAAQGVALNQELSENRLVDVSRARRFQKFFNQFFNGK